jgi:hypothetical protein
LTRAAAFERPGHLAVKGAARAQAIQSEPAADDPAWRLCLNANRQNSEWVSAPGSTDETESLGRSRYDTS